MAERARIALLPPEVAQRIAAGEVIDRPASVVRELLDNALDAGARAIEVEIRGGGLELIMVSDDGHGMPRAELPLAFARHGTSKIRRAEDLSGIATLGFRGEALASIAAMATVEVTTAEAGATVGARMVLRAGAVLEEGIAARTPGATVRVRDLFAGHPVRRSFLPSSRAEIARCTGIIRRYVLAWPEVRFLLRLDDRQVLRSAGLGDAGALATVFGEAAARMHPFGPLEIGPARIDGYLGDPGLTRGDSEGVILVVNRRPVAPTRWLAALERAYRPLLPAGRHPVVVLRVTVPPDQLDVNLHPAKLEVRMADEELVITAVTSALRDRLGRLPAAAPILDPAGRPRQRRLPPGRALAEDAAAYDAELPDVRRLRVLGQLMGTLIVAEDAGALYLIDQHRADERAIYEALASTSDPPAQELLQPLHVELRPGRVETLEEALPELARLGFRCERFGRRAFLVRSAPAGAPEGTAAALAATIEAEWPAGPDWRDRLLVSVACRAALRRGRDQTPEEMQTLLARLAACAAPAICPHGSPIIARIGAGTLRRHFDWG